MENYLSLLGLKMRDVVTGMEGVVTSISFDVSGCVQGLMSPGVNKEGKLGELHWFDVKRLIGDERIVPLPEFVNVPGGENDKPVFGA